jgi:hypothetical protein
MNLGILMGSASGQIRGGSLAKKDHNMLQFIPESE